jgi:hypothetical protein
MSTYRTGKFETWDGVQYYNIEKKTLFGWKEMNYWVIYRKYGSIKVQEDSEAKLLMMESVDRLVKAGHTVI